ncbi:TetR/AcrR family transcriptional regulator [Mucilaginibacter sp. BJC16-A38]|uniref:TetR/AcrR family transcriptional regulator n=1 Tax=Mucilaginibacter phenanthrenivorans TaxID=1234842 RepID=UPI00215819A5|nr:TetR/AcrR family transcriptional regulator [Mucilaginibacter phenanthrenivorans]MCR8559072.1 TetR/AcrR family transcriptional regulator [Mucilaginibacter phenanthrenivorans]
MSSVTEVSTEEKIKDAARKIFTKKGFLATTIRDIATEADINIASINYYFRSKEKLFEFIMDETIDKLFNKIEPVLNNETMAIDEKIELCVGYYIDNVLENPDFVFFTVSEVMSGSLNLSMVNKMKSLEKSHFARQLKDLHTDGKISFHPVNLLWNITGMIFFPFLTRPRMLESGYFTSDEFVALMQERKKLIPVWMRQIINGG